MFTINIKKFKGEMKNMADSTNTTNLREAVNRWDIEGILAEIDLKKDVDAKGNNVIKGNLVVKVEDRFETISVYNSEKKSDGTDSKAYKALETIMAEYKSIADTGDETTADKIRAFGSRKENTPKMNAQGEVKAYQAWNMSFSSRVKPNDNTYNPSAKWMVEVFVQGYKPEKVKEGDELVNTGRTILQAVVPAYGGKVFPVDLILEGEGADWFEDNVPKNSTVKVYCDIRTTVEKSVQEAPKSSGGFGQKQEPKVFTKYHRDIIVVGAEDPYDSEDESTGKLVYDKDLITKALAIREQAFEEAEAKGNTSQQSQSRTGFGSGQKTTTPPPTFDEDDLPF